MKIVMDWSWKLAAMGLLVVCAFVIVALCAGVGAILLMAPGLMKMLAVPLVGFTIFFTGLTIHLFGSLREEMQ